MRSQGGLATNHVARSDAYLPPATPPSGEQVSIANGDQAATIVEVGGALRDYSVGGAAVLDGYAVDEICDGARGQTLIPWPNRLKDGRFTFDGRPQQLPLSEPAKHNAIHGLVRWASWEFGSRAASHVSVRHTLRPRRGWPFSLALEIEYRLFNGLLVTTRARNVGAPRCPYAAGAHPYLTVGGDTIDDAWLCVPARSYLTTDEQGIPTGRRDVAGSDVDFRTLRRIGSTRLDLTFTDLERDPDGWARILLAADDGSRAVTLLVDESYSYVELFTGDTLERVDKRRTGLGVEPMTAPPNALQTGIDLFVLEPGTSVVSRWGIEPTFR